MLVLTRRLRESIVINGDIRVTVLSIQGQKVRLGIEAAPEVCVDRQEIHERRRFRQERDEVCNGTVTG